MNIMNENIFEHETHNLTMKRDAMKHIFTKLGNKMILKIQ